MAKKNDPYSYYDGVNKFNRFDKHEVNVKACDPYNCSRENIAIRVIEINDPPRIVEFVVTSEKKPILNRDFHVQFTIIDPDYDFNSLPYGSYKLTVYNWLICSQQGHKVGSMLIICKGIPRKKEDNKFSIDIMFNDGNSKVEESFKYEAIDYADFLNP